MHLKICEWCEVEYEARRSDSRFCSDTHRTASAKAKNRGQEKPRVIKPPANKVSKVSPDDNIHSLVNELQSQIQSLQIQVESLSNEVQAMKSIGNNDRGEIKYISMNDAIERLGVSRSTLDRKVSEGIIKKHKLGGKTFFSLQEINSVISPISLETQ